MNHIIIEGFMGSGKGTVGKKLAAETGFPLIETDKKISERMKMTPNEIYDRFGDVYYRAMETYVLMEMEDLTERSIIILGSGLPTMPANEKYLHDLGRVYYLQCDKSVIVSRLDRGKKKDWLEENDDLRERVTKLLAEREPSYLSVADVVIKCKKRNATDIVKEILEKEALLKAEEAAAPAAEEAAAAPAAEEAAAPAAEEATAAPDAEEAVAPDAEEATAAPDAEEAAAVSAAEEAAALTAEETPAQEEAPEPPKKPKKKRTVKKTKKEE